MASDIRRHWGLFAVPCELTWEDGGTQSASTRCRQRGQRVDELIGGADHTHSLVVFLRDDLEKIGRPRLRAGDVVTIRGRALRVDVTPREVAADTDDAVLVKAWVKG